MISYYDEEDDGVVMETPQQVDVSKVRDEEIKKEVRDLESQIDVLCGKLKTIQDSCRHPEKEMKFINIEGKQEVRWVCGVCNKIIGYPTPEDVKKFLH